MTARDKQAPATNSNVALFTAWPDTLRIVLRAMRNLRLTSRTIRLLSDNAIVRTTTSAASFTPIMLTKASLQGAVTPFNPHS